MSSTGFVKVFPTGDQRMACSRMESSSSSVASLSIETFTRTAVKPATFSSGVSPVPQTAEVSIACPDEMVGEGLSYGS